MSAVEAIATLLGIACVALAARRSVWTFPAGIASVTLVGIVVFEARLYSDAILQGFFVAANLYGWANWRRAQAASGGGLPIGRLSPGARAGWLGAIAGAAIVWGTAMRLLTDAAYPLWDAGIAMASIAAQILMARRRIEHWWLWVAVDVAAIPLYLARELWAFAGLYLVYLALSVLGLRDWRRAMRAGGIA
jgi:nicotinamide mononucleotide transporter